RLRAAFSFPPFPCWGTNRQDCRFARRSRPKGEGHGWPECRLGWERRLAGKSKATPPNPPLRAGEGAEQAAPFYLSPCLQGELERGLLGLATGRVLPPAFSIHPCANFRSWGKNASNRACSCVSCASSTGSAESRGLARVSR